MIKRIQNTATATTRITEETIQRVVNTIAGKMNPQKIVLFGSAAHGEAGPDSDLDLLLIMESDLPRYKRAAPIHLLFRPYPCPMDFLVYTPTEIERYNGVTNHIVTEALTYGRTVYEDDGH